MEIQSLELDINAIDSNERQLKSQAKCIKDRLSTLACNNPNCTQYAFVCDDKQCQCRKKHKKCLFTDIDQIIEIIHNKRSESKDIIDKVSTVFENWIDEISKTRQKIEIKLRDWGLSPAEKKFIDLLKTKNYNQLTGNHINQITTKTIQYFTEQIKEKLMTQIDSMSKNYQSQIKSIMKTVSSLFDKFSADEKDTNFEEIQKITIDIEQDFVNKVHAYFRNLKQPYQRKDYQNFVLFFKQALTTDFSNYMKKYKQSRRVYGTKKLRQKYFEDYFAALSKGEKYYKQWEIRTQNRVNQLNKSAEYQLLSFCNFYRQSDGAIEKPFSAQTALSLQKTINTIYLLTDFVKLNGKQMIRQLYDKNKRITEKFEMVMYFLDGLMDQHPEIDEVETIWNVIRFEDKIKNEVNYLYDIMEEALKDPYEFQIKVAKNEPLTQLP